MQKTSFSNTKQGYFVVEISNTSLISGLTTKIGDKALFILRNRPHSFVAENWARWPITGPTNDASIFVITREKTALSSRQLYMSKLNAEASCL